MPRTVSRFEANLIRVTRALVGRLSLAEALPLLLRREKAPKCLSRDCVRLVEDTLATGFTERFARLGWTIERHQRGHDVVTGRLWKRTRISDRTLAFSAESLRWLTWMTSDNFADPADKPKLNLANLQIGDRLLWLQTVFVLNHALGVGELMRLQGLREHALIALLFPDLRAEQRVLDEVGFARWLRDDHAWAIEAFSGFLIDRWVRIEQAKRQSADLAQIRRVSAAQQQVLDAFLDHIARSGRWDLSLWMLTAAQTTLRAVPLGEPYFPKLQTSGLRMTERSMLYEQGLVLFRALERLRQHHADTQAIGFYDDEYQTSQLWKSEWERLHGDDICWQARELVQQSLPLRLSGDES